MTTCAAPPENGPRTASLENAATAGLRRCEGGCSGEAKELNATFAVPASGVPLFEAATANLLPWTEVKVEHNPERGPLLILSGEKDNTVPRAISEAAYKIQERNPGVTEFAEVPGRGHSLTIDHGWHEVASTALAFIRRFV